MEDHCKNMRLREWLITQIESGKYSGLSWENEDKTMFRIPWKHAAKQDYNQNEDAALFKAWAVYKGKYREGEDKADPSVWKTRLRCALNKSPDFLEVPERGQLDVSEPYKVYRIQPEGARGAESPESPVIFVGSQPGMAPLPQPGCLSELDRECEVKQDGDETLERLVGLNDSTVLINYDYRLRVRLFYQGQLVQDFTTSTPEGCRILHGPVPVENERIYGPCAVEPVHFPSPVAMSWAPPKIGEAMVRLLPHLERGVLVWAAPDGVFIKRFCQGRVYWDGPLAQYRDRPNKLEREKTCKLLDMVVLMQELQQFLRKGSPSPRYRIDLCFGEEFPEPGQTPAQKLITASVEPLFARKLVADFNLLRSTAAIRQRHQTLTARSADRNGPLPVQP